jgi:hypothetical protein
MKKIAELLLVALITFTFCTDGVYAGNSDIKIDKVYFAQTHVQEANYKYFNMVGNRKALIKAHVVSPKRVSAPSVTARLKLNGKTRIIALDGPSTLAASFQSGLGVVQHKFDDCFTGYIPADWVEPGLRVEINAGQISHDVGTLNIGAPTKLAMNMFDIHFFGLGSGDYGSGWKEELQAKWPVADLELRRVRKINLPEWVVPGDKKNGTPPIKVSSPAEYKKKTGKKLNSKLNIRMGGAIKNALKNAAGYRGGLSVYYVNVYGLPASGRGIAFGAVGPANKEGFLNHETGHALGLPHWSKRFPYQGDMHGIEGPDSPHAGPVWAFDLSRGCFIEPTVQPNTVGKAPIGRYKKDPMRGGGSGDQEKGFLMRHYADYSVFKIRNFLHKRVVVWNEDFNSYATWNDQTKDYTTKVTNNGIEYPVERDVDVISILAAVSSSNPEVNHVCAPIGPYKAGLIKLFDPRSSSDRDKAQKIFTSENCDVSLKITQGGKQKIYMVPIAWTSKKDHCEVHGMNLPARDGTVTKVELIRTPNAEVNGLGNNPNVLYKWVR